MTLDESRILSTENLTIAVRCPSSILAFIRGGKIRAYQKILSKILMTLSKTRDEEILRCLTETLRSQRLILPEAIHFLNGSRGLVPLLVAYYLVRVHKPSVVVETGVWTGKTSWFILQALEDIGDGNLISVDLGTPILRDGPKTERLPTKEIGELVPKSLRDRWQLTIGDSTSLLPQIASELIRVDLFLHDSDHSYNHMMLEFEIMWPRISKGGFLCSDDIEVSDAWQEFLSKVRHTGISVQSRLGVCQKLTQ